MKAHVFPLGDRPDSEEQKQLGKGRYGAIHAGEFRCPKKGEWFFSGAVPHAYKAPNDLSHEYYIARLVLYKTHTEILKTL